VALNQGLFDALSGKGQDWHVTVAVCLKQALDVERVEEHINAAPGSGQKLAAQRFDKREPAGNALMGYVRC